jgi:3-phosphoshikimate 1-carboxyvinyltransferase
LTLAPDATVEIPGSKSLSNRALLAAGLANGTSRLCGLLDSDDTQAMIGCLRSLGVRVDTISAGPDEDGPPATTVVGVDGSIGPDAARLDARQSGVTARFMAPVLALSDRAATLDGHEQLRARPMGDLIDALRSVGAAVEPSSNLPLRFDGGGVEGGAVSMPGSVSSQFLSAMLMAAPYFRHGLRVQVDGELVSRPYVDMTLGVMEAFGASVGRVGYERFEVRPGGYRAMEYTIEPDASSASYFFALAAMSRGRILIDGLGTASEQGDLSFVDVLERMGAVVRQGAYWTEVVGRGLVGVDVDMSDISDCVPTLCAVAACAETPSRIRGVGFIRGKESNRIAAMVTELNRIGVRAQEHEDGLSIYPVADRVGGAFEAGGPALGGTVETYEDHRIAMAFGVLGSVLPGIAVRDPGCVAKTFPEFWSVLDSVVNPAANSVVDPVVAPVVKSVDPADPLR